MGNYQCGLCCLCCIGNDVPAAEVTRDFTGVKIYLL